MNASPDTFTLRSENIPCSGCARLPATSNVGHLSARKRRKTSIVRTFLSEEDDSQQLCRDFRKRCRKGLTQPSLVVVSAVEALSLVWPYGASAAETLPLEFIKGFLENVEHLGPLGPMFFVATMVGAEMVPLFPTQPLTIASGILFGAPKGALLALVGTSTAAVLAFQLSRRLGQKLAEKATEGEISEETRQSGIFARVQNAVESGSFQQQVVAVMLLRLTPVVPFSATNYLLGATPLKFPAYLVGSLAGLTFWCSIYATLGGAGRELLNGGVSLDVLFEDLLARASGYTQDAAIVMGALGILALLYYKFGRNSELEHDEHEEGRT